MPGISGHPGSCRKCMQQVSPPDIKDGTLLQVHPIHCPAGESSGWHNYFMEAYRQMIRQNG